MTDLLGERGWIAGSSPAMTADSIRPGTALVVGSGRAAKTTAAIHRIFSDLGRKLKVRAGLLLPLSPHSRREGHMTIAIARRKLLAAPVGAAGWPLAARR
jgi:hypothetical protein